MRIPLLALALMGTSLAVGCKKSEPQAEAVQKSEESPTKAQTANNPTKTLTPTAQGLVIRAEGKVSGIADESLAKTTADNRARAEIVKKVQAHLTQNKMPIRPGAREFFFAKAMRDTKIVKRWRAEDGSYHSLAEYAPTPLK